MKKEFVLEILSKMGIHKYTDGYDYYMISCPFAKWKHRRGTDRKPSFGISYGDGFSLFNCFSCGTSGVLSQLPYKMYTFTRDSSYLAIYSEVLQAEADPELLKGIEQNDTPLIPLNEKLFDGFYEPIDSSTEAIDYLKNRGVSLETAKKLDLQYDDREKRIVFPIRGTDKKLYGFSRRAIEETTYQKIKNSEGLQKSKLILGADRFDNNKPILLVEGLFGYAHLHEVGAESMFNIMALLGCFMSPEKERILKTFNKPVYVLMDNDKAGYEATFGRGKKPGIAARLQDTLPVFVPDWPVNKVDPDQLTLEDITDIYNTTMPFNCFSIHS